MSMKDVSWKMNNHYLLTLMVRILSNAKPHLLLVTYGAIRTAAEPLGYVLGVNSKNWFWDGCSWVDSEGLGK